MKIMNLITVALLASTLGVDECESKTSDSVQTEQQERILQEGTSQVGMPAITRFTERKLLKDILELRDRADVITFTYLFAEQTGKLIFLCQSVGYGLPAATQFTSPQKIAGTYQHHITVPQADPNGLFSPTSAEGTWVLCKNPTGDEVKPFYVEPRVIVSPFMLADK